MYIYKQISEQIIIVVNGWKKVSCFEKLHVLTQA